MDATDRGGLIRLDEEACWRFVARHFIGRVALVHEGEPMVFPVNYALDYHTVVFRSAPGTKLTLARVGTRVAFEVDEASPAVETGTSVVVHGTLHEVAPGDERERLSRLPTRTWAPGRDHILVVRADRVTGRAIPAKVSDVEDGG